MSRTIPWIDPSRPLPPWLQRRLPPEPTRSQVRAREYYLQLHRCTPPWETRASLATVYNRAHDLRDRGFDVEVDHVIPLNHPDICGLHTVANLEIVSRAVNQSKSNNHYPDMRHEQLSLFENNPQLELDLC